MTTLEKIQIAKVSQYLSSQDVAKGDLFSQRRDVNLPKKLYMERMAVEWMYNMDPNDSSLEGTSNYLYALCGRYAALAAAIIAGGGGGSIINPVVPGGGGNSSAFPIYINSSDFEPDGVSYNNSVLVGKNLTIFVNEYSQQFLFSPVSFTGTATGIQIVIPGFDASVDDYNIIIMEYQPA